MGPIADARTDQLVYAAVTGIFEYNFNINKQVESVNPLICHNKKGEISP